MDENGFNMDQNDIETIQNDKGAHTFKMGVGKAFVSVEYLMLKFKKNRGF